MIDEAGSEYYDVIHAVQEYLVPFEPVTNNQAPAILMPSKSEQIQHAKAAIASINERVYYRGLYEGLAIYYKEKARAKIFNDGSAAMYFELVKQGWKKPRARK